VSFLDDAGLEPPQDLDLPEGEVHVWSARLDPASETIERLRRLLDPQEAARASRFRFEKDRTAFTVARGILRWLLAGYLGEDAAALGFVYGPQGKPSLENESVNGLHFNVTHSALLALFAFVRTREIGIDVERVREQPDLEDIARRFFSKDEVVALRRLPRRLRDRAFFRCWTRKEAYIKARGGGLSIPLDEFSVSFSPGEPAALRSSSLGAAEIDRWSLRDIPVGPAYAAALVVEGRGWSLRRRSWPR
jgi:4'-phosphopantetheinyl transferase